MKKFFLQGILVLFLFSLFGCCGILIHQKFLSTVVWGFALAVFLYLVFSLIYHNYLKMYPIGKKNVFAFYICFLLIQCLSFFVIYSKRLDLINLFLFAVQLLSGLLFSLFVRKEGDKAKWIFSLLLITLSNFIFWGSLNPLMILFCFIANFTLYVTTLFDDLAIYRKKNFIFMTVMGMMVGCLFKIYPISVLYLFFLGLIISRKRGLKCAIKLSTAMVGGFIVTFLMQVFDIYSINSFNRIPIFSNMSYLVLCTMAFMMLIGTCYCLKKHERKMGYCTRAILIILFITSLCFPMSTFLYATSLFMPVLLLTLMSIFENMPALYHKVISIYQSNVVPQSMGSEKVSVVIPNYNYENYLNERIDSVLFQSYRIAELIILDDCSKDRSIEVIKEKIKEIQTIYPEIPVKFIPNEVNSGNVFKQWSKCFEVASGDYLWICEADDSADPRFLEQVMLGFQDEDVVVSYAESLTIDENNQLLMPNLREWIDIYGCHKWDQSYIIPGSEEICSTMCINNTIANVSSVVFRLKKNIPYVSYLKDAQQFKLSGDWYFYLKVLEHGNISYCHKSLNYHRMHSKSVTLTTKNDLHYKEICRIHDMVVKDYSLSIEVLAYMEDYRDMVRRRYCLGHEELRLLDIPFEDILKKARVKDEVLLSIIVPVYNTEKYLEKCLDSVLVNIPPKTEVIVVNDGSPDNSKRIIEEYEKKYPNIVFGYDKKNGGLSSAKNYGLSKAKGRYVIYLDSDDFVAPNMYMTMLKKALEEDASIVYCDMFNYYEDGTKEFVSLHNFERESDFFAAVDTPMMTTSCNKIVKKSLYQNLKFPEGLNNEDVAVTPILFDRADKICYVDSAFYYYFQRSGSIQNSEFQEKRFVLFDSARHCLEKLKDSKHLDEIKGSIYTHQFLGILLFILPKLKSKERKKYIALFCDHMNEFDYINNPYVLEYVKTYRLSKLLSMIQDRQIKKLDLYLLIKMY